MAIEDIFRALEEQAEAECGQILRSAREQADAIVAEAKAEAGRNKQERIDFASGVAKHGAAQIMNAARLANRKELAGVRDQAIERVFEEAGRRLRDMRRQASYQQVMSALAGEAFAMVEPYGDCTLQVAAEDAALAEQIAAGRRCDVDASLDASGGVVVSAAGGRVVARNTFEDRLAKVRRGAQSHVAEMLFE